MCVNTKYVLNICVWLVGFFSSFVIASTEVDLHTYVFEGKVIGGKNRSDMPFQLSETGPVSGTLKLMLNLNNPTRLVMGEMARVVDEESFSVRYRGFTLKEDGLLVGVNEQFELYTDTTKLKKQGKQSSVVKLKDMEANVYFDRVGPSYENFGQPDQIKYYRYKIKQIELRSKSFYSAGEQGWDLVIAASSTLKKINPMKKAGVGLSLDKIGQSPSMNVKKELLLDRYLIESSGASFSRRRSYNGYVIKWNGDVLCFEYDDFSPIKLDRNGKNPTVIYRKIFQSSVPIKSLEFDAHTLSKMVNYIELSEYGPFFESSNIVYDAGGWGYSAFVYSPSGKIERQSLDVFGTQEGFNLSYGAHKLREIFNDVLGNRDLGAECKLAVQKQGRENFRRAEEADRLFVITDTEQVKRVIDQYKYELRKIYARYRPLKHVVEEKLELTMVLLSESNGIQVKVSSSTLNNIKYHKEIENMIQSLPFSSKLDSPTYFNYELLL